MSVVINGTSGYIADFSNATVSSRQAFQTSTTNGSTGIYALPNGTSTTASWQATNAADPTNASKILIATNGSTDVQLVSGINGTGTYLPMTFWNNGAEKMRLATSGNFGIGQTSPSYVLDTFDSTGQIRVARNKTTTGDMGGLILGGLNGSSSAVSYALIQSNASTITAGSEAGNLDFYTMRSGSITQAARIDSSGNLLVGRTSALNSASRLQVDNSGNAAPVAWFYNSNSVDFTASLVRSEVNKAAATTFELYSGYNSVAKCFTVYGNGNVQNTNNSYGALSDAKLKENITDATPKLAQLNQVRIVNYNLIGDEHKQLGVIAQELEQVFPAMVEESPDRDAEGNDIGTTTKSVKYSVFVPMLIKAIQEQQAIITQLQADVEALKAPK
jgi:hypothetical protein